MGGWVDTNLYIVCLRQVVAFAPKVIIACIRQVVAFAPKVIIASSSDWPVYKFFASQSLHDRIVFLKKNPAM